MLPRRVLHPPVSDAVRDCLNERYARSLVTEVIVLGVRTRCRNQRDRVDSEVHDVDHLSRLCRCRCSREGITSRTWLLTGLASWMPMIRSLASDALCADGDRRRRIVGAATSEAPLNRRLTHAGRFGTPLPREGSVRVAAINGSGRPACAVSRRRYTNSGTNP